MIWQNYQADDVIIPLQSYSQLLLTENLLVPGAQVMSPPSRWTALAPCIQTQMPHVGQFGVNSLTLIYYRDLLVSVLQVMWPPSTALAPCASRTAARMWSNLEGSGSHPYS
jgi:hypothetical protein